MKKLLLLTSVSLFFLVAAPALAQEPPSLTPFDQGAELDAACGPSGICYREFGSKFETCTSTGFYAGCHICGNDSSTKQPSCFTAWSDGACYCKLASRSNTPIYCVQEGRCSYIW